ncbi:thiamine kinase-like enzyme [Pedobacter cryoconitis]|uniref:phosphotransferase enzyme family protein n=1 Tax=Pedobacter cryoconitis TaxID=188932 RepID=UPI00160851A1|nr:aminoglycoside phosphotransferase family protein [Pedobacter cryoconitis]MBB6274365.1 thiamine kinase-like enzyme [Pedobacter cryoconitis]
MKRIKNLFEITSQFKCHVDISSLKPYGTGHINDTYRLKNLAGDEHDYLLQKINQHVFKDIPRMTENICRVIAHLKKKMVMSGKGDPEKEVMTMVATKSGPYFYQDSHGEYWRMCHFLKHTKTYDVVETEKQAYEGGKAFGKFQAMLCDLSPDLMYEVIPDFHDIEKRLGQLAQAIHTDSYHRVQEAWPEIKTIQDNIQAMLFFQEDEQRLTLPIRVTHNDTKFNNVLLNLKGKAQCIIDLDTVMADYIAYDFGDAIRTIINTGAEDEKELSDIRLNLPLFNAYTKGYMQEAGQFLDEWELRSLIKGVLLLPYMQAVRFLTDYLNGDTYYKIESAQHNLQRTRAQLQLLKELLSHAQEMEKTIYKEAEKHQLIKS